MNVTFPKNFPYKATFLSALEAVCDNAGKAFTSVQESFVSFGGGLRILTVLVKVFKKFYSSQMIGTVCVVCSYYSLSKQCYCYVKCTSVCSSR